MQNLAAKYRPTELSEIVEQSVVIDIVKNICESNDITNRNFLFIGPAGCGKALTLDMPVLTTSGFKPMREIQVGDEVITHWGNVGKVSGVYPQGKRPIYRLILNDGAYIDVSDNHLNVVYKIRQDIENAKPEFAVIETTDMITSPHHVNYSVPVAEIDEWLLKLNLEDPHRHSTMDDRLIKEIRYQGEQECQCIYIDHPDHTFISNDFIPTHNTTTARAIARELNGGSLSNVIEMDAASHSGVDSVRELIEQMRSYPVGTKYKIFILDECFWGGTLVSTENGLIPIKDIKPGTIVSTLKGSSKVKALHSNLVRTKNLRKIKLSNGTELIVSANHLFFTSSGWVTVDELDVGEMLYAQGPIECITELFNNSSDSQSKAADVAIEIRECGIKTRCFEVTESDEVGSIPQLLKAHANCRGGWDDIEYELGIADTSMQNIVQLGNHRVSSIQKFSRGDYLSFSEYFPDDDLSTADFVTMYDLEIDGHPSYFAEDILVHNCHAFSSNAWQALLKTLEEQPARTIVALCTTNPEKIPATILSRVQTFQLSKISLDGIYNRLKYIVEEENKAGANIKYTDDALMFLAKICGGGMRDGITSLDQSLSYSTDLTVENVMKSLDLPNYDDYFDLLNAIAKRNNEKIVAMINTVYNSGVNFVKWFEGFFSFITNIVKYIYLQDINQTMIPSIYQDKISGYGPNHSALCLKLSNKLVKMNQELKTTQYLQELAISYLCTAPTPKK